jgi:hypothetical protein
MIDPALRKLRLDRRLLDRRGWIDPKELARELAALPDVSAKIAPAEEASASAGESLAADTAGTAR